jgi:hypothetical protein
MLQIIHKKINKIVQLSKVKELALKQARGVNPIYIIYAIMILYAIMFSSVFGGLSSQTKLMIEFSPVVFF